MTILCFCATVGNEPNIMWISFHLLQSKCVVQCTCKQHCLLIQDIRECVFSITWQRWRSHDHSIIAENAIPHANFTALPAVEPELLPTKVLHRGNREFRGFFAVATLTLTRWPSYTNLTRIPCRYTSKPKRSFLRQGFRKLSYYIITYIQWYRQTYRQMPPKLLPRCFAGGMA